MLDFNTFFTIAIVLMLAITGIFFTLTLIDCRVFSRGCQERRKQETDAAVVWRDGENEF